MIRIFWHLNGCKVHFWLMPGKNRPLICILQIVLGFCYQIGKVEWADIGKLGNIFLILFLNSDKPTYRYRPA